MAKILIVDDDPDFVEATTIVLEKHNHLVISADSGEAGYQRARSEKPDLIILDVLMPRQSGIRLYRELRTNKALAKVKVIILSGIAKKTFLRSQQALTEFGETPVPEPDFYIEKPVDADVLAETIKKAIG